MKDVIELAKQAGIHVPTVLNTVAADKDALIRFAALVRNAALEEAAQKCSKLWDLRDSELARVHAAKCAAAIESLKEPTP